MIKSGGTKWTAEEMRFIMAAVRNINHYEAKINNQAKCLKRIYLKYRSYNSINMKIRRVLDRQAGKPEH